MKLSLKSILESNLSLKVMSFFLGIGFWCIYSAFHPTSINVDVPVCFYGRADGKDIEAPETINVKLMGKRTDFYNLDLTNIALHINTDELVPGEQVIEVSDEKLFLPKNIKLVHCSPLNPVIIVKEHTPVTA